MIINNNNNDDDDDDDDNDNNHIIPYPSLVTNLVPVLIYFNMTKFT